MKLNLVMPMGGGGTRFGECGFHTPKPLLEIYGKPFFYWAVQSVVKFIDVETLTFVVLEEHMKQYGIDVEIKKYYPKAHVRVIPKVLPGAVLTCLEGIADIPKRQPVLFNDCDHLFICRAFNEFCHKGEFQSIDGGLLTFRSNDAKYSFAVCDANGNVDRTVEKQAVSKDAVCGAYYFKDKETFQDAARQYLGECRYQEFFVSGVYNILAGQGKKVIRFSVDKHVSFGTPDEYETAKKDQGYRELEIPNNL